jgi:glucose uptake protein GlcU
MKALIAFIKGNGITISSTKANKGFNINSPSQVTDVAELTQLVTTANPLWDVTEFRDTKFDTKTGAKISTGPVVRIYVGPKMSKFDVKEDAVSDFIEAQM